MVAFKKNLVELSELQIKHAKVGPVLYTHTRTYSLGVHTHTVSSGCASFNSGSDKGAITWLWLTV